MIKMSNAHLKCRIRQNEVEFDILNAYSTFERSNATSSVSNFIVASDF